MPEEPPGQVAYKAYFLEIENTPPSGSTRWQGQDARVQAAAAAGALRPLVADSHAPGDVWSLWGRGARGGRVSTALKPPFPYFGGKRAIASLIWEALGDVAVYVEPFLGSASVLLARPHAPKVETVNDKCCFLANFWRAIQHDPAGVAQWADSPVSEVDLHARHRWLMAQEDFLTRMRTDPDYYDAKLAGWWVWGQSMWIGHGWCVEGCTHHAKLPQVQGDNYGNGVVGKGHLGAWFAALAARLRYVRVCCGDWSRICTPVVLNGYGITGIYLDPPYSHQERTTRLYSVDEDIAAAVATWALEHGGNPCYRIVLSGYQGEHTLPGWQCVRWQANGGYGNQGQGRGKVNAQRECLWLSPHCVETQLSLFGATS